MTTTLDDRIQSLQDRLSQLKVRQARAEARQQHLAARSARRDDTRRKILVGAIVLDRVAAGSLDPATLKSWLDAGLNRPADRALFDLPSDTILKAFRSRSIRSYSSSRCTPTDLGASIPTRPQSRSTPESSP